MGLGCIKTKLICFGTNNIEFSYKTSGGGGGGGGVGLYPENLKCLGTIVDDPLNLNSQCNAMVRRDNMILGCGNKE